MQCPPLCTLIAGRSIHISQNQLLTLMAVEKSILCADIGVPLQALLCYKSQTDGPVLTSYSNFCSQSSSIGEVEDDQIDTHSNTLCRSRWSNEKAMERRARAVFDDDARTRIWLMMVDAEYILRSLPARRLDEVDHPH